VGVGAVSQRLASVVPWCRGGNRTAGRAAFYGPATFYTIKLTSSLTFTILGSFKQLLLLVGAAAFVDHESDPRLWVGLVIVCIATAAYSYQNHRERSQREAAASKAKATEATPLRGAEKA
jgi:hypothetical protein